MSVNQNNTEALSQYLVSMVKLEELQKMTEDLDKELEDSQRLMSEIKSMFNNIPNGENRPPLDADMRHEQLAQFLAAQPPQLLMPDMETAVDVDIEKVLVGLKNQVEELNKNIVFPENQQERAEKGTVNLNLEQYAANLEQFSKSLENIRLNKANGNNRNAVLEMKLPQVCEDLHNLSEVVNTMIKLIEADKNGSADRFDNTTALCYNNLINKVKHNISDALYLLRNRT